MPDQPQPKTEDEKLAERILAARYLHAEQRCRRMRNAWPPFRPEQAEKLALILTGRVE